MGDEFRVTQAIRRAKQQGLPERERLKIRLEQIYNSGR
jgi:hypothetical protein